MPRGRHRQSSALLRISVLAGALAPALVAVVLVATGAGAGVLRIAVVCAVVSALVVVGLLRQSRRGYGQDLARQRRERERLTETMKNLSAAHEETLVRVAARERELATARKREAELRTRVGEAETLAERAEQNADEADRRAAVAQARERQAESRAREAAEHAVEAAARAEESAAELAELRAGIAPVGRPVRPTTELFAAGAAALRGLEHGAEVEVEVEPTMADAEVADLGHADAVAAEPEAAEPEVGAAVDEAESAAAVAADVEYIEPAAVSESGEETDAVEPAAAAESAPEPGEEPDAADPVEAVEPAEFPHVPGVRRPPIAVEGLVPAYAASLFGPAARPLLAPQAAIPAAEFLRPRTSVDQEVEAFPAPAAERLPVPRPTAEAAVPEPAADEVPDLDLGVDALEPAVSARPADDAIARVVADVAETVRAVQERMARAADGSFDFFGRSGEPEAPVAAEPPAEPAVAEPGAYRRTAARTAVPRPVPPAIGPARPLVTHEPRTGRAIPVDLTAHDDTEQLPIVDIRKHA